MRLTRLNLEHFRNVTSASLDLDGLSHFFLGLNGQGKTNLLEAAGMISALRSFRVREAATLIQHDRERAGLFFQVEHERDGASEVTLYLGSKGKRLQADGETVSRLGDYVGRFPTVTLCADDIQMIRGGPALRRNFLDGAIASVDPGYYRALTRYQHALQQRNRLLKDPAQARGQLASFDKTLAPPAWELHRSRTEQVRLLNHHLQTAYAIISEGKEQAELVYQPRHEPDSVEAFLAILRERHERDLRQGATSAGPHRDDLGFLLNDKPAQDYGSEGQQRGLVTALRLAQITRVQEITGCAPVILADDVLGELDAARERGFWRAIGPDLQVLASGTEPPPDVPGRTWRIWRVESGQFTAPGE